MRRAKSTASSGINSGGNAVPKLLRELHQLKHQIQVIVFVVLCMVCIQYLELIMSVSVVQLKGHKTIRSKPSLPKQHKQNFNVQQIAFT